MSRARKLIIGFWIFIGCMLLWQFYDYDQGLTLDAKEHPKQEHFWFTNAVAAAAPASPEHRDGPDVEQTSFSIEPNKPSAGMFTCNVTLKNMGNAKAVGVQASVHPYRGISMVDEDVGHPRGGALSDNDPISQIGTWLTFPDLVPGGSATESATFVNRSDVTPGRNPNPEILFQTEKAK